MIRKGNFIHKWSVELIIFIVFIISVFFTKIDPWHKAIAGDGLGYYAYLPAVVIYQDADFEFTRELNVYVDFWTLGEGTTVNKYFIGLPILLLPFFLLAHVLSLILGLPADGYSILYQYAVVIAAIFYLYIGLLTLRAVLRQFSDREEWVTFILTVSVFGTNLLHYATYEQSMTHVYSFSLISFFLWATYKVIHLKRKEWIWISCVLLSLIILLRPVNGLIILAIPFLARDLPKLKDALIFIRNKIRYLIYGLLLAAVPVLLQTLVWYWQSGHWIVYSYGDEGFNWNDPEPYKFLFSYRKGWFLWTPIAFIALLGFLTLLRKRVFSFISMAIFWLVLIYVQSSWWLWMYGMSFGSRPMVDYLALVAIGLALLYNFFHTVPRLLLTGILIILLGVNLVQSNQYRRYILHWDGMVKETYWDVFLKLSQEYEGWVWEHTPGFMTQREKLLPADSAAAVFEIDFEGQYENVHLTAGHARSGKHSNIIDNKHSYSHTFTKTLSKDEMKKHHLIQASVWYSGKKPVLPVLAISINNIPQPVWLDIPLVNYYEKGEKWNQAVLHAAMPKDTASTPEFKVFVWNLDKGEKLFVDDMKIEFLPVMDTTYKYEVMIE